MPIARLVGCCLLVVSSWGSAVAAESQLLWKFNVGDVHHYRMTQDMDMKMSIGADGRQVETSVQQILHMTWRIEKIDDQGRATLNQTVDRVQMDMQAPGQPEMHYDTDSDESPAGFAAMMAPLFKAMTAEPFVLTMTPRGQLLSIEMPEGLTKAMETLPGAKMMGEMFSDEGFKKMFQKSSLVLPEPKDLEPGHEWMVESKVKNAQFGELDTIATYRYLGQREVKDKPYEVFSIDLKMEFGEGPGGVQMDVTNHSSSGEILFSRELGQLESSTLQQDMDIDITAAGQAMKQNMVQTVTFERVESKDQ